MRGDSGWSGKGRSARPSSRCAGGSGLRIADCGAPSLNHTPCRVRLMSLFSSAPKGVGPDETTARTGRKGGEVMVYCELFSSAVGVGREGRGCI